MLRGTYIGTRWPELDLLFLLNEADWQSLKMSSVVVRPDHCYIVVM